MRGMEIAREYYEQFGRPMLESRFPDVIDRIAAGIAGEGSECLGYDDDISRDHDFDPGFCIWITAEDERNFGFRLSREYSKLPKDFMGLKRLPILPVGGSRRGVLIIEEFYTRLLGCPDAPNSNMRWLRLPPQALRTASNGQVFTDPSGRFSAVRDVILRGYPEDVRRKKLAAHTVMMAQAGQYNFQRCIHRGEKGAAQLAVYGFIQNAISAVYLLNGEYEPFYKWAYRGMRELAILPELEEHLCRLGEMDNSPASVRIKLDIIENIAASFIAEIERQGMTRAVSADLEKHAYSIADSISDGELRNMHIMEGI